MTNPLLEKREYIRRECVVFRKTKEDFGGLSNMAAGFDLQINRYLVRSVEAFYQACRFPHNPDLQRVILEQRSPMAAKMKGKPFRQASRSDWDRLKVRIMRWSLHVKLLQHRSSFGDLLERTASKPIVEDSRRDDFWGAIAKSEEILVGANVLGRLLVELREKHRNRPDQFSGTLIPLEIPNFMLLGEPIQTGTVVRDHSLEYLAPVGFDHQIKSIQNSLFDGVVE